MLLGALRSLVFHSSGVAGGTFYIVPEPLMHLQTFLKSPVNIMQGNGFESARNATIC